MSYILGDIYDFFTGIFDDIMKFPIRRKVIKEIDSFEKDNDIRIGIVCRSWMEYHMTSNRYHGYGCNVNVSDYIGPVLIKVKATALAKKIYPDKELSNCGEWVIVKKGWYYKI
jgi:hypothetical protein